MGSYQNPYGNPGSTGGAISGSTGNFTGPVTVPGASTDAGGYLVHSTINPSTYYREYDWDDVVGSFQSSGNTTPNVDGSTAGLLTASTLGVRGVFTSSATAGGYTGCGAPYAISKNTQLTYRWRGKFYVPAVSTAANRYTVYITTGYLLGTANNTFTPFTGAYLAYSDSLNSGNWVLGSAVAGTQATANSTTAYTAGYHTMAITLLNGTYTYVLDGTTIGTLTDANILTTNQTNQSSGIGGIAIVPDGTNYTTTRVAMIDRSDFYVTGLTR